MLETGVSVDTKKARQAFYTPAAVAARVVELAEVSGQQVLEPSAGAGALVKECVAHGAKRVVCVEIDAETSVDLKKAFPDCLVHQLDFLTLTPVQNFTRVVMNPPFTKNQDIKHVQHALKFLKSGGLLVAVMASNQTRKPWVDWMATMGHFDPMKQSSNSNLLYEVVSVEEVEAGAFSESGTKVATLIIKIKVIGL